LYYAFVIKYLLLIITGPPTHDVEVETSSSRWCLSSSSVGVCHLSSVTLPAGGRAGRRASGRTAAAGPTVGHVGGRRPTLHGGPVWLRPIRAKPR